MAKVKSKKGPAKRDNRTTTALYNLAKRKELAKKTGSAKAALDKAERERPIKEMNRRSAQIKADIKKRTTAAKEKGKMDKAQKAKGLTPSKTQAQKAAIAIKYKKR